MRLSSQFFTITVLLLTVIIGFSYFYSKKNYDLLFEKYLYKSKVDASNIKTNLISMFDEITYKHNNIIEKNKKEILKELNSLDYTQPIKDIQNYLNNKFTDSYIDVFFINKDYIVYDTTYKFDLGLDFKNIGSESKKMKQLFDGKNQYYISHIINDPKRNTFIQYIVYKPKNFDSIIELGITIDKNKIIYKYIDTIRKQNSNLKLFKIFTINDSNYDKEKIHIIMDSNTKDHSKNETVSNLEKFNLFKNYYEYFIDKKISNNMNQLNSDLIEILNNNDGFISKSEYTNNNYIQKILTNFHSYQNFSENRLGVYLYMEFEQNDIYENIKQNDFLLTLFLCVIVLLIVISIYLLYLFVVQPLILLNNKIDNKHLIENDKILNRNNEISNLINKYNLMIKTVNKEIQLNSQLLYENKRFISDTVHQIRTPLTNIMMNGEMIKMFQNDETLSEFIEQIDASINMLSNSYEDLAYVTSYDTIEYKPTDVSISAMTNKRVKFFETISKVNFKKIVTHIEEDIIIHINEIECERIIDNNISNGVKYADANKPITITLKKENDIVTLCFKTYGNPIKNKEKVFEKNYRENEAKRGLGLGLNMVKGICEKYDIIYSVTYEDHQNIFTYQFKI